MINANPFSSAQGALPLVIWSERPCRPKQVLIDIAFQAAFVLISVVLILFVLARIFSRTKGKKGRSNRARPTRTTSWRGSSCPIPIEESTQ